MGAGGDDDVRMFLAERDDGVGPFQSCQRHSQRSVERMAAPLRRREGFVDEVRDDLRVRVALKHATSALQLLLERKVILDDAVVHHHHGARPVRVCVLFARPAVRGPPGVADADLAGHGLAVERSLQVAQLAFRPTHIDFALINQGDSGGVVTAVLEPAKAVEQQGAAITGSNVSNDAAHGLFLSGVHIRVNAGSLRC